MSQLELVGLPTWLSDYQRMVRRKLNIYLYLNLKLFLTKLIWLVILGFEGWKKFNKFKWKHYSINTPVATCRSTTCPLPPNDKTLGPNGNTTGKTGPIWKLNSICNQGPRHKLYLTFLLFPLLKGKYPRPNYGWRSHISSKSMILLIWQEWTDKPQRPEAEMG